MTEKQFQNHLQRKQNHLNHRTERLQRKLSIWARLRLSSFLILVSFPIWIYINQTQWNLLWWELLPVLAFGVSVFWFLKLERSLERMKKFQTLISREKRRFQGTLEAFHLESKSTPIASDLNLTGSSGLLTRLDTTFSQKGHRILENLSLHPGELTFAEILERQKKAKWLSDHAWVSIKWHRLSGFVSLLDWKNRWVYRSRSETSIQEFGSRYKILSWISWVSGPISVILFLSYLILGTPFGFLPLLFHSVFFILYRTSSRKLLLEIDHFRLSAREVVSLLEYAAKQIPQDLANGQALHNSNLSRIQALCKDLLKVSNVASYVNTPGTRAVLNIFFLRDVRILVAFSKWLREYSELFAQLVSDLELWDSILPFSYLAITSSSHCFPEILESGVFAAEELSHPLLSSETRVPNPVSEMRSGDAVLVTGSNMSGKTTYLRTIGINTILGLAGGPVFARKMSLPVVKIHTSIRNEDNLQEGISFFYAEVQKITDIVHKAEKEDGLHIVLLDEIFKGTNSKERFLATRAVLKKLMDCNAITWITSHDLELANLKGLRFKHFSDFSDGDKMVFDYKIREGVISSTNAIRLLKSYGLDLDYGETGP